MTLVIEDREVLEAVVEDRRRSPQDGEARQRERLAGELGGDLLDVVVVEVAVAARPDELAGLEVALLRHHVREQRVGGDVERHAEEDVGAALVELARQPPVRDVELEERVAGRQFHPRDVADVPRRHDQPPRVGVAPDLGDELRDLVDVAAVGCRASCATGGRRPGRGCRRHQPTRPRWSRRPPAASGRWTRRAGGTRGARG